MTKKEHIKIHKEWHEVLDWLVADWITCTKKLPSKATILDLIKWSYEQTKGEIK